MWIAVSVEQMREKTNGTGDGREQEVGRPWCRKRVADGYTQRLETTTDVDRSAINIGPRNCSLAMVGDSRQPML